jgi:hypothetical protein
MYHDTRSDHVESANLHAMTAQVILQCITSKSDQRTWCDTTKAIHEPILPQNYHHLELGTSVVSQHQFGRLANCISALVPSLSHSTAGLCHGKTLELSLVSSATKVRECMKQRCLQ